MLSSKDITEKLHVLAVLEHSSWKNAYGIRRMLWEWFVLNPHLNTLRKNLQRCYDQGLIEREKRGGSYHYRIMKRGRERLRRIRAKRQKKLRARERNFLVLPEGFTHKKLFHRVIEVTSAVRLCDIVLRLSSDNTTLNFARNIRHYWYSEFVGLVPYITERIGKTVENISTELGKTLERLLVRLGQ